jgi:hypothetical protein
MSLECLKTLPNNISQKSFWYGDHNALNAFSIFKIRLIKLHFKNIKKLYGAKTDISRLEHSIWLKTTSVGRCLMKTSTVRPKNQAQFHKWAAANVPELEGRTSEWLFIWQILKETIPLQHKRISMILSSNSHVSIFPVWKTADNSPKTLVHTVQVTQEDPDLLTTTDSGKFLLFSAFGEKKKTKHYQCNESGLISQKYFCIKNCTKI